jgi:disulfide bond formation protein DsbB
MGILKKTLLLPPLVNFSLGLGLIVGAYIFEVVGYYDPCPLCILQRWSFALIALCGALMMIPRIVFSNKKNPSSFSRFIFYMWLCDCW